MKSSKWWILAVVVGSQAVTWGVGMAAEHIGQSTSPGAETAVMHAQDAPRMTIDQLAAKQKASAAPLVIDLRSTQEYAAGHVAHAINVPFEQLGKWATSQKPEQKKHQIVMYCACKTEHASAAGAVLLHNQGFTDTWALKGGWTAWQEAKNPVHTGTTP